METDEICKMQKTVEDCTQAESKVRTASVHVKHGKCFPKLENLLFAKITCQLIVVMFLLGRRCFLWHWRSSHVGNVCVCLWKTKMLIGCLYRWKMERFRCLSLLLFARDMLQGVQSSSGGEAFRALPKDYFSSSHLWRPMTISSRF